MNKKQWYRRSADTCRSCSSSPNSTVWYRLPADTRVISSEVGFQALWYRRAADTRQYRGNVFRGLHLYRRMQVLCRWIQTCPPSVCFLFRRIGPCYQRLASVRTSSLLRFRIPALRLLDRSCFPFTPIQTDSFDRKKMSQGGPATSGTTIRP